MSERERKRQKKFDITSTEWKPDLVPVSSYTYCEKEEKKIGQACSNFLVLT